MIRLITPRQSKDPVLLTLDMMTHRVRRYEGKRMTLNVRLNRIPDFYEIQQLRDSPQSVFTDDPDDAA
jgi:hypothetical protein